VDTTNSEENTSKSGSVEAVHSDEGEEIHSDKGKEIIITQRPWLDLEPRNETMPSTGTSDTVSKDQQSTNARIVLDSEKK